MSISDRATLVEAFSRAWAAKDLDALMALMADDCTFRASVGPEPGATFAGRDAVREAFQRFLAASGPPPETEDHPTLVGEDFAVTRWTLRWSGGERGPTVVHGCDVFEFEGDRIRLKDTYRKLAQA